MIFGTMQWCRMAMGSGDVKNVEIKGVGDMSSCEKCWQDAAGNVDEYGRLIKTRQCSPEEQAGLSATICLDCNRLTVHQYTGKCQNPDCLRGEYHTTDDV